MNVGSLPNILNSLLDNSPEEQREELNIIIDKCLDAGIEEMVNIGTMLDHWKEEILNSF